jgi:hypothetical protein
VLPGNLMSCDTHRASFIFYLPCSRPELQSPVQCLQ